MDETQQKIEVLFKSVETAALEFHESIKAAKPVIELELQNRVFIGNYAHTVTYKIAGMLRT